MLNFQRQSSVSYEALLNDASSVESSRASSAASLPQLPAAPTHPVMRSNYFRDAFRRAREATEAGREPIAAELLARKATDAGFKLEKRAAIFDGFRAPTSDREKMHYINGDTTARRLAKTGRIMAVSAFWAGIFLSADTALVPVLLADYHLRKKARTNVTQQDIIDSEFHDAAGALAGVLVGIKENLKLAHSVGAIAPDEARLAVEHLGGQVRSLQHHPSANSKLGLDGIYRATRAFREMARVSDSLK